MSHSLQPFQERGRSLVGWVENRIAGRLMNAHVLVAGADPPVEAMRCTYLEAVIHADSPAPVRLHWDDAEGERVDGPLLSPSTSDQPARIYVRDHPRWQGSIQRVQLSGPAPFQVERFTLYGERDLALEEKFAWPSEFALVAKRRVVNVGEPVDARLIVPNRLLRALGDNEVVFTLTDSQGSVLGERRTAGRMPLEPFGVTDFFAGAAGAAGRAGRLRLEARVFGAHARVPLTDSIELCAVGPGAAEVFAEPFHYVGEFAFARLWDSYHLFYTTGQADASQAEDAPRSARQLGHATSQSLTDWSSQEPVLPVERYGEETAVRSPCVVERDGTIYLFHASANAAGAESIRLATSADLVRWERIPEPVHTPNSAWSSWSADRRSICRAPCVARYGDAWLLYTNAQRGDGRLCVSVALSRDLVTWIDAGIVLGASDDCPQVDLSSPALVEYGRHFLLFTDGGLFISDDPLRGWRSADTEPRPEGWRGWEFVGIGQDRLAMAFRDLKRGNYAQVFRVHFSGDSPVPQFEVNDAISLSN